MSLYVLTDYWITGYAEGDDEANASRGAGAPGIGGRRRPKRKKWILGDRQIIATREELEAEFEQMLEQPAPQVEVAAVPKVAAKDRQIVSMYPQYPDIRDMLIAAQQIEAAQILRAVAARMAAEEDERDVEVLLLYG